MGYKVKTQQFRYDFLRNGGAVGFIPLGLILPAQIGILSVNFKVVQAFTSGGGGFAAFEIGFNGTVITNPFSAVASIQDAFLSMTFTGNQVIQTQEEWGLTISNDIITAGKAVFILQTVLIVEQ